MPKKKAETIDDILDRIEDDLQTIRDKASEEIEEWDDSDEIEDSDSDEEEDDED